MDRTSRSYQLTRFALVRGLGVIYAVGFWTLVRQWRPLFGAHGLLPAADFLSRVGEQFGSPSAGFWHLPSLFWLGASDAALGACAWLGFAAALVVVAGFANAPLMAMLWALYLSFVHVGQIFYGYGWESLLCEAGFLAIFLVPAWNPKPFATPVPWPVLIAYRWLAFRVMFGAGLIKLRGDTCWTDFTCLDYHYETQPLPNPLSAIYHHLPPSLHVAGVLFNHFAELIVPFGVFGPRRVRQAAGAVIVVFQSCLISSGNLAFLNWLTIVIALPCFDDSLLPGRYRERLGRLLSTPPPLSRARWAVTGVLLTVLALLSLDPVENLLSSRQRMNGSFEPFGLVNTYGAFGSITRERNEIVLEGTSDAVPDEHARWQALELPCKPGDPERRPCIVAPYQYKLDWQLWFAAFDSAERQPWLIHLVAKLLRGDHGIDSLFALQPFRDRPPRYVRARFYRYRFAASGSPHRYWDREPLGEYLRPLSLDDPALRRYLLSHGFEGLRNGG